MLIDRQLTVDEVVFLADWFSRSTHILAEWPASVIAPKVAHILADGEVTAGEAAELQKLMEQALGNPPEGSTARYSTRLDCEDESDIVFAARSFCFTGKFECGERKECQRLTSERGGVIRKTVTLDLDYLVIGTLASRDWANSNHGRKIEAALVNRDKGGVTSIVSEDHWRRFIGE